MKRPRHPTKRAKLAQQAPAERKSGKNRYTIFDLAMQLYGEPSVHNLASFSALTDKFR